jgi:hypothetical protein
METMPVTTANTVCVKGKQAHRLIVNLSGNRRSMPGPLKNDIKIRFMGKIRPAN